jgi:predicted secreted protein
MADNTDAAVMPIVHGSVLVGAYVIFWFLALFCLLPVGLGEVDPETGAPLSPKLLMKAGIATAIATVLWVLFYVLIGFGFLEL